VITFLTLVLALLLLCSAFFSCSETALFSLSSIKVRSFGADPDPRKQRVAKLLSRPKDLLVTIILLNILVNILVQNIASSIFDQPSWLLNVGVPLLLTLLFGEIVPKSIGLANNMEISYRVAPTIQRMQRILTPLRLSIMAVTNLLCRLFFFLQKEKEISVEELRHALKRSKQFGVLNEDEAELVRGYLKLEEANVKDLMRPREEMLFFDLKDPVSKLIHLFVDQECSRIPVARETIDQLIGIMTSRLFFLHRNSFKTAEDLLPILKKPFYVPETLPARILLQQFYEKKEEIAIVVDEYGSISGLIALEDLVEEVVGKIADRRDEKSLYTRSGKDVIIASGKLELTELEEILEISFDSPAHMVTIGGWLTEKFGDIPKSGMKYETEQLFFHVLAADPNRIRRVYIKVKAR